MKIILKSQRESDEEEHEYLMRVHDNEWILSCLLSSRGGHLIPIKLPSNARQTTKLSMYAIECCDSSG